MFLIGHSFLPRDKRFVLDTNARPAVNEFSRRGLLNLLKDVGHVGDEKVEHDDVDEEGKE